MQERLEKIIYLDAFRWKTIIEQPLFAPIFCMTYWTHTQKKEEPRFSPWWKMDMLRIYLFSYLMRKSFADFPGKAKREPLFFHYGKKSLGYIGSDAYLSLVIIVLKEKTNKYSNPFSYYGKNWYGKNWILQIWKKLGDKDWEFKWQKISHVFFSFRFEYSNFLCYISTFARVEKDHSEPPSGWISCHLMGVAPTYFKLLDFFNYHPLRTSCDIFFVKITDFTL